MAENVPIATPAPARGFADIPGVKQVGLLAGVAAAVAAAIWLLSARRKEYRSVP